MIRHFIRVCNAMN